MEWRNQRPGPSGSGLASSIGPLFMKKDSSATANDPEVHFVDENDDSALSREGKPSGSCSNKRVEKLQAAITARQTAGEPGSEPALKSRFARSFNVVFGVLVLISAGYLAYSSSHLFPSNKDKKASKEAAAVVTVTTYEARKAAVDELLTVTGSVSCWDELKVGTEVGGLHVKAVYVEEGDRVKKGQLLAELNSGLLEAQLWQAEARLKSAEASLAKSVQPNRPEDIATLKAALAESENIEHQEEAHFGQAKVNLESAEINVPRYENLARMGAVSIVEAETRRYARDTAKLELKSAQEKVAAAKQKVDQARQKLLLATKGGRKEDVLITKASIEEIKAQVKHLKEQLKQTRVVAHDDGLILQRNVHIGDTSNPSTPMFVMSRLHKLELRALVNDLEIGRFHPGQQVKISTSEDGDLKATGTVRLVSPQIDAQSRLGVVRIDLPDDAGLKPGMFVRGETRISRHEGILVPAESVVSRGGESFVFKLKDRHAVSTTVETGMQGNEFIEIKSGLSAGDKVIKKGARFLSDGDLVDLAGS